MPGSREHEQWPVIPSYLHGDGGRAKEMLHEAPREIHFIGASVTAQRRGWADCFVDLARERTGYEHTLTKNAMGGVGLLFGVANHQPPVAVSLPRLVFIEFSTGDLNIGLTPDDKVEPWLDHLVARLHAEAAHVVLVHNWRDDVPVDDARGFRRAYDRVAKRRAIPVLCNHRHVSALVDGGFVPKETLFRDVCHTTPEGAQFYARHAMACLEAMADAPVAAPQEGAAPCSADAPIGFQDFPSAPLMDAGIARSEYTYASTRQSFPVHTFAAGQALELEVSGSLLGVSFLSGPRTGWVGLSIDGTEARRFRCFDRNSFYERYILLPAVFGLSGSTIRLYDVGMPLDLTIASRPHPDFTLPRLMKVVQLVGAGLVVSAVRVVNHDSQV